MSIKKDKVRVSTILTKKLKEKLQKLAAKDNRSLSSYIANVLEKHSK